MTSRRRRCAQTAPSTGPPGRAIPRRRHMMWALVAIVGVAGLAAITTAAAALVVRGRREAQENTFRCCVRVTSGTPAGVPLRSPSRVRYASWAHDVLVLRRGPALQRRDLLPVESAVGVASQRHSALPWQFGPRMASLSLRLDDGSIVEVRASSTDTTRLCGPYLLAALEPQPKIPNPKESP